MTLGDGSVAQILGRGRVDLRMTSGKLLSLCDVLHVPTVRRNLISGSLLVASGYMIVLEANKVIISKNDVFIGRGYVSDGLFKLSLLNKTNFSASPIVLNVESGSIWHKRFGHVNLAAIKRMMNLNLIPKTDLDVKNKCEICVQSKHTRLPFKSVDRNSDLLELIHSDVCDSNRTPTRGQEILRNLYR